MRILRVVTAGVLSTVATVLLAADYTVSGQYVTIPVQQPQEWCQSGTPAGGDGQYHPCTGYVREPVA